MARHETSFEAAEEGPLTPREGLSVARDADEAPSSREDALACFLSAAEGWDEAVRRLAGAFADVRQPGSEKD